MVFQRSHYFNSLQKLIVRNEDRLISDAKFGLTYDYQEVPQDHFKEDYPYKNWHARKIISLPAALFSLTVKTTYHLFQALFAKITHKGTAQAYVFKARRDVREAYGWFITLFRDRAGQFYVQESDFHKTCYDCFIKGKNNPRSNTPNSSNFVNNNNNFSNSQKHKTFVSGNVQELLPKVENKLQIIEESEEESIEESKKEIIEESAEESIEDHRIIEYTKGEKKTNEIVSCCKEKFGSGGSGKVYFVRNNKNLVVKKSFESLEKEFKISKNFNHENLIRPHRLIIKNNWKSTKCNIKKFKIEMDYAHGKTLDQLHPKKFDKKEIKEFIKQVKSCCLYLHDIDVVWDDVNSRNIIIEPDNKLKIIDYGFWKEKKGGPKTNKLLLRSIGIVEDFLANSTIKFNSQYDEILKKIFYSEPASENFKRSRTVIGEKALFPKESEFLVFGCLSLKTSLTRNLKTLSDHNTNEENKQILEYYFDCILQNFEIFYPND